MIQHRIRIGNIFGPVINWANGFNFELQHSTVIQKHRDARETRESLWGAPRFSMDFRGVFMGTDAEDFISDFQLFLSSLRLFSQTNAFFSVHPQDSLIINFESSTRDPMGFPSIISIAIATA